MTCSVTCLKLNLVTLISLQVPVGKSLSLCPSAHLCHHLVIPVLVGHTTGGSSIIAHPERVLRPVPQPPGVPLQQLLVVGPEPGLAHGHGRRVLRQVVHQLHLQ